MGRPCLRPLRPCQPLECLLEVDLIYDERLGFFSPFGRSFLESIGPFLVVDSFVVTSKWQRRHVLGRTSCTLRSFGGLNIAS